MLFCSRARQLWQLRRLAAVPQPFFDPCRHRTPPLALALPLLLQVEGIARELSQCHRTQQPAVAAQLRDARQQLAQHQQQAAALQASIGPLQQAAQAAADAAEQARLALQAGQAQMIAAVEERQRLQQEIRGLMEVRLIGELLGRDLHIHP
jgi:hypothetical protein